MLRQTVHVSQSLLIKKSGGIGLGDIVTRGLDDEDGLRHFDTRPLTHLFDKPAKLDGLYRRGRGT